MPGRIPVPSFALPADSPPPASAASPLAVVSTQSQKRAAKNAKRNANAKRKTPAVSNNNKAKEKDISSESTASKGETRRNDMLTHLLQLEGALQQYLRQKANNKNAANPNLRLSLDEFYGMVRKLDWQQQSSADSKNPLQSFEERVLHQLMVVTADPTLGGGRLYHLLEPAKDGDDNTRTSRHWSLESVAPTDGNKHCTRMEHLKRLAKTSNPSKESHWNEKVAAWIVAHRKFKTTITAQPANTPHTQKKKVFLYHQAKIVAGMTVEERVRARALAKEQNRQLQRTSDENGHHNNNSNNKKQMDRTWLIQFADALWSHARHLVRRQRRSLPSKIASQSHLFPMTRGQPKSNNLTKSERPCVLTFADVVDTMARSRLGKLPSRKIAKALKELQNYEPRWIVVVGNKDVGDQQPSSKKQKKDPESIISKSATIKIHPEQYPAVRDQLTGQVAARKTLGPIPMTATTVAPNNGTERKRPSPASSTKANLLENFDCRSSSKKPKVVGVDGKTATVSPPSDDNAASNNKTGFSTPAALTTKKRARDAGKTATSSTKKRLRINNQLILSDADYHGGEVLQPSELDHASPRGLKGLFRQLNSGERI